jgi:exodeoxyribonuclease VII small subunit
MAKFEDSIKELEKIVKSLEDGEPNLDESLKNFEKGISLIKVCQKELESAENKIKELTEDGQTKPFNDDAEELEFRKLFSTKSRPIS